MLEKACASGRKTGQFGVHRVFICWIEQFIFHRCKKCKGEKTVKEKTKLEVFVEKGMADKERIILKGQGDQEVKS